MRKAVRTACASVRHPLVLKGLESLESRLLLAFGQSDTNFGVAGRAAIGFTSNTGAPTVEQILIDSNNKILAGGDKGIARFSSAGVLDSSFGASGKTTLSSSANFIAEAIDASNGKIYVLVSASAGTGLFRYSANGILESAYGQGGTVTVTSSKSFTPQALTVQSDGKVLVAGVFKTNSSNGRKVRVYRLKTDGTTDTGFGNSGSFEFNLGTTSFLFPTVYDQVAGISELSGGKILVAGGTVDYSPAGTDPDTGNFIDASYDKAAFAVARLTSAGAVDSSFGATGFARADYATGDDLVTRGLSSTLPRVFTTRADGSAIVAGSAYTAAVVEFGAGGTIVYNVKAEIGSILNTPVGLTVLNDGRSVVLTTPVSVTTRGFAYAAISTSGVIGNAVLSDDTDTGTEDIDLSAGGGDIATASDGRVLVGGSSGNDTNQFLVEKILVGSASDARPDEFAGARANDIVKDSQGGLHLAYYNAASTHLVYAYRAPNGVWDAPVTVDTGANAGQYVSIDSNSHNLPGIAYFDGSNGDLKLATFDGTTWHRETVESKGSTGLYPSFQYDNADEPVVTYFNKTKGKLTFALKKSNVTWGYENVDASGDNVGRSSVLLASPNTGRYTVAYVDNSTGSVKWAGHGKGGTWDVKVAATTKGGADFLAMAYGYYGQPAISYYDAFAADLKITYYDGSAFVPKSVATSGAQGLYSSIYFGSYYDEPKIIAYNRTQDKVSIFSHTLFQTNPTATDAVTGAGKYVSVDWDGTSTDLAYYDATAGVLKVRPGPSLS